MAFNRFITYSFLLLFFWFVSAAAPILNTHPYHVGVCQIEWRTKDNTIGIMIKLFSDDLDAILLKRYQIRSHLGMPNELKEADTYIKRYLEIHIQLTKESKRLQWKYIGRETEDDTQWIYIEVPADMRETLEIKLRLTVLMDLFADQVHFVHYKCPNGQVNCRLYVERPEMVLKCDRRED